MDSWAGGPLGGIPGLPGGTFVVGKRVRWYDGNLLAVGKYTPEGARWAGPPTPPHPVSPLPKPFSRLGNVRDPALSQVPDPEALVKVMISDE